MTSSIISFLSSEELPEKQEITIWLDNCSYQNKNYLLFQALLSAVQNSDVPFQTVTLRYCMAGQSFMAADSYHSRIESQFRQMPAVLNFRDFATCSRAADQHCVTKLLTPQQFLAFPDEQSQSRISKSTVTISQICSARFSRR